MKTRGIYATSGDLSCLAAACILAVVLTACTGRGGGHLPPRAPGFTGQASFGFTFSCENRVICQDPSSPTPTRASNPIGSSFGIHGISRHDRPSAGIRDLHRREPASPAGERADLPGPLPA